ncbi:MAG: Rod shape-determining protein RodA [Parcubacteria group bacterium GW2011_GWF2_38_76]|nr:MAG: Rod shape-determining protein RodA [Parcubacteria group bacterium GW2011_GWF2_38_76]
MSALFQKRGLRSFFDVDWILVLALIPILGAGLLTMNSFVGDNYFAERQIVWISLSFVVFLFFSQIDWRFLKDSKLLVMLFSFACFILLILFLGNKIKGARSWIEIASISIQPADFTKILLILILSKYFSKRHMEIASIKHLLISGTYMAIPFLLIFFQPDFGSAVIIFLIWFGMIIISGVSRKHLIWILSIGIVSFIILWMFVFLPHQKQRIATFLDPLSDIKGAGYNAFQSQIAIGSGQLFGKGVGFGTQSRLNFLPEYETDFIFAAFAEEWGFVGVITIFFLFGVIFWRILLAGYSASTNFETLYSLGFSVFIMSQFIINVGMNIGLLPVTGLTIPFMSYGGSHLLTEFGGLGILMGMKKYSRATHRDNMKNEFLGPA